jgi:hypothetical protein
MIRVGNGRGLRQSGDCRPYKEWRLAGQLRTTWILNWVVGCA